MCVQTTPVPVNYIAVKGGIQIVPRKFNFQPTYLVNYNGISCYFFSFFFIFVCLFLCFLILLLQEHFYILSLSFSFFQHLPLSLPLNIKNTYTKPVKLLSITVENRNKSHPLLPIVLPSDYPIIKPSTTTEVREDHVTVM